MKCVIAGGAALLLMGCGQLSAPQPKQMNVEEVSQAFEAMRAGRGTGFEKVLGLGDGAIASVSRYLSDSDDAMRGQAIAVLGSIGTPAACDALASGLRDSLESNRSAAVVWMYRKCSAAVPASAEPALRKIVADGTADAEALLLLGGFATGKDTLEAAAQQSKPVHLAQGLPVPAALAVAVAAKQDLQRYIESQDISSRLFLLATVSRITSPKDLRALTNYLDDVREAGSASPAGGRNPQVRRVCDLALDALAARAKWQPEFKLDEVRQYSAEERSAAKKGLSAAFR